jgi:hypothetical protein
MPFRAYNGILAEQADGQPQPGRSKNAMDWPRWAWMAGTVARKR